MKGHLLFNSLNNGVPVEQHYLSVNPGTLNYDRLGGDAKPFDITCDTWWSIEPTYPSWIAINIVEGFGNATVLVLTDSFEGDVRTALITVIAFGIEQSVNVNQIGYDL